MGKGIFYAVSVGAGDPLDMTLRAKQVLEQAEVLEDKYKGGGGGKKKFCISYSRRMWRSSSACIYS